jgi:hypothetical protein
MKKHWRCLALVALLALTVSADWNGIARGLTAAITDLHRSRIANDNPRVRFADGARRVRDAVD